MLVGCPENSGCPRSARAHNPRSFSDHETKPKVLVADPISERGIAELADGGLLDVTVKTGLKEDELLEIIGEFDGARGAQRRRRSTPRSSRRRRS